MAVKSPNDLASLVSRAPDVGTIDLAYVYNGRGFQTKLVLGGPTTTSPPRNAMTGGMQRSDALTQHARQRRDPHAYGPATNPHALDAADQQ